MMARRIGLEPDEEEEDAVACVCVSGCVFGAGPPSCRADSALLLGAIRAENEENQLKTLFTNKKLKWMAFYLFISLYLHVVKCHKVCYVLLCLQLCVCVPATFSDHELCLICL